MGWVARKELGDMMCVSEISNHSLVYYDERIHICQIFEKNPYGLGHVHLCLH